MIDDRRRRYLWLALTLVATMIGHPGCSSSGSSDVGESALISVQMSPLWITVENKAGMALTELQIEIIPAGSQVAYATTHWRLESGEKRDFASNVFRSRDNTPFNIRVSRPKAVRVSAKDVAGNVVRTEVPWK